METKITNQQALIAIYNASKQAPLTAEQHTFLLECAKQLEALINPTVKEEKKK